MVAFAGDDVVSLVRLGVEALRRLDVEENGFERAKGVLVTTQHEVAEADIVVNGDLAGGHARVEALGVEFNIGHDLESLSIVA